MVFGCFIGPAEGAAALDDTEGMLSPPGAFTTVCVVQAEKVIEKQTAAQQKPPITVNVSLYVFAGGLCLSIMGCLLLCRQVH
jgi:hypothetical protein